MKILIAPDKFKGSLAADEVCQAIQKGINKYDSNIEILLHPLADGGEGTIDILGKLMNLENVEIEVHDPLLRPIFSFYKKNHDTAFIEMASASGLELLKKKERNPMHTSTFGTGELILDAIQKGVKKIYLFIGGSATNDAGIGMAAALGFRFFDKKNKLLSPVGENLIHIHSIDAAPIKIDFSKIQINVVCDVENILFGKNGAAHVYASQKGASLSEIKSLDLGLQNYSKQITKHFQKDISQIKGAGAAGGLGAGAMIFLNAKIQSGIQTILQITDFEKKLEGVDLVITGEGKLDAQTLEGKVIKGVADISKKKNIPVDVICGVCELSVLQLKKLGIRTVEPILREGVTLHQAISEAAERVEEITYLMVKNHYLK